VPVVDVHWHHVPAAFAEAVLRGEVPVAGRVSTDPPRGPRVELEDGFVQGLGPELTDDGRIAVDLDAAGIDVALVSVAPPLSHLSAPAEVAVAVSRALNDAFAVLAQDHGGRLIPLANLPLQDPRSALAELHRVVRELGFRGVAVGSNVGGRNLGDEVFLPFWERVRDEDLFVFVHGLSPLGRERLLDYELSNFVGLPVDTTVAVASMIFGGVFRRLPGLKVCLSHGGGAFPCLLGRWDHGYAARLRPRGLELELPSRYVRDIFVDSLTHDPTTLCYLVDRLGPDHVLLGSDRPFDMGERDPVGAVKEAIGSPEAVEAILGGTACRLLGLT